MSLLKTGCLMLAATLLLVGCYSPDNGATIEVAKLSSQSLTLDIKKFRVKKDQGNGRLYYYPSEPFDLKIAAHNEVLNCTINIKNPNASNDRAPEDSEALKSQCVDNKTAEVSIVCSPDSNDRKDVSCQIDGLMSDTIYEIGVRSNISHPNGNNSKKKTEVSKKIKIRTPPEIERQILRQEKGDNYLVKISDEFKLVSASLPRLLMSDGFQGLAVQSHLKKYNSITVDGLDGDEKLLDFIVADFDNDGSDDIIAINSEHKVIFIRSEQRLSSLKFIRQALSKNEISQLKVKKISRAVKDVNQYVVVHDDNKISNVSVNVDKDNLLQVNMEGNLINDSQQGEVVSIALNKLNSAEIDKEKSLLAFSIDEKGKITYRICIIDSHPTSASSCEVYDSQPSVIKHTSKGTWNENWELLARGTNKVLTADFNADGLIDVFQVREGIIRFQQNQKFNILVNEENIHKENRLLSLFAADGSNHAADFLQGMPVIRDAFPVSSLCNPIELSATSLHRFCGGRAENRVKPIYEDARSKGQAIAGYFKEGNQHVHRWQMINTDGAISDFDQDGDVDIVVQVPSFGSILFLNQGDGKFFPYKDYPISSVEDAHADRWRNGSTLGSELEVFVDRGALTFLSTATNEDYLYINHVLFSDQISKLGEVMAWFSLHLQKSNEGMYQHLSQRVMSLFDQNSQTSLWAAIASNEVEKIKLAFSELEIIKLRYKIEPIVALEINKIDSSVPSDCRNLQTLDDAKFVACGAKVFSRILKQDENDFEMIFENRGYYDYIQKEINKLIEGGAIHTIDQAAASECVGNKIVNNHIFERCIEIIDEYNRGVWFIKWNKSKLEKNPSLRSSIQWESRRPGADHVQCWGIIDENDRIYSEVGRLIPNEISDNDDCWIPDAPNGLYTEYLTRHTSRFQTIQDPLFGHIAVVIDDQAKKTSLGHIFSHDGELYCGAKEVAVAPVVTNVNNAIFDVDSNCHFVVASRSYIWSEVINQNNFAINRNSMVDVGNQYGAIYLCKDVVSGQIMQYKETVAGWKCSLSSSFDSENYRLLIDGDHYDWGKNKSRHLEALSSDGLNKIVYKAHELPAVSNFSRWLRTIADESYSANEAYLYVDEKSATWSIGSKNLPEKLFIGNLSNAADKKTFKWYSAHDTDYTSANTLDWPVFSDGQSTGWGGVGSLVREVIGWTKGIFNIKVKNIDFTSKYFVAAPSGKLLDLQIDENSFNSISTKGMQFNVPVRIDLIDKNNAYRMVYDLAYCDDVSDGCVWILDAVAMAKEQQSIFLIRDEANNFSLKGVAEYGCINGNLSMAADFTQIKVDVVDQIASVKRRNIQNVTESGVKWIHAIQDPMVDCHSASGIKSNRQLWVPAAAAAGALLIDVTGKAIVSLGSVEEITVAVSAVAASLYHAYDSLKEILSSRDDFYHTDKQITKNLFDLWSIPSFDKSNTLIIDLSMENSKWFSTDIKFEKFQEAVVSQPARKKFFSHKDLLTYIEQNVNKDFSVHYEDVPSCSGVNVNKSWPFDVSRAEISKRALDSYNNNGYIDWSVVFFDQYSTEKMYDLLTLILAKYSAVNDKCDSINPLKDTPFEYAFKNISDTSVACWAIDIKKFTDIFNATNVTNVVGEKVASTLPHTKRMLAASSILKSENGDKEAIVGDGGAYIPPKWSQDPSRDSVKSNWLKAIVDKENELNTSGLKSVMPVGMLRLRKVSASLPSQFKDLDAVRMVDVDVKPPKKKWKFNPHHAHVDRYSKWASTVNPQSTNVDMDEYFDLYWQQNERLLDPGRFMELDCAKNLSYADPQFKSKAICFVEQKTVFSFANKFAFELVSDNPVFNFVAEMLKGVDPLGIHNRVNRVQQENICQAIGRFYATRAFPQMLFGVVIASGLEWTSNHDYAERSLYSGIYLGVTPRTFGDGYMNRIESDSASPSYGQDLLNRNGSPIPARAIDADRFFGSVYQYIASQTNGVLGIRVQLLDEATAGFGVGLTQKNCHKDIECRQADVAFLAVDPFLYPLSSNFNFVPSPTMQSMALGSIAYSAASQMYLIRRYVRSNDKADFDYFYGFYWDARPLRFQFAINWPSEERALDYGAIFRESSATFSVFPARLSGVLSEWGKCATPDGFEDCYRSGPQ